jgi:predicted amidohydrolase YtcJ
VNGMTRRPAPLGVVLLLLLLLGHATQGQDASEVLIRNARVITLDGRSRIAEAVAIRGDRIIAVGTNDEIGRLAGPDTKSIDAGGKALLPGLYDSHVHPLGAATSEKDHPIPAFNSLEDIKAYIVERARIQPKGSWIVVRYAFPTRLAEGRFPTRAELDAIAPDHPVLHQAGPAGMANTKALEVSGVTRDTPDPPAGRIVKDRTTGEPTGMLRNAYSVLKNLPSNAYADEGEQDESLLKALLHRYNERGITSIGDRAASEEAIKTYRRLRDRGELTVRVNATRVLSPPFGSREEIAAKLNALAAYDSAEPYGPTGVGDHWVRIGPMKVFLDGGMLNGTAYMRTPWGVGPAYQITEPDYRGLLFIPPPTLATIAEEAARRGWQMTAHCAGEAGMDELLAAYEAADRAVGIRNRRWLITHANFTSSENLKKCAELGVGADLQPAWLWKDTRTLLAVLGPQRMEWFHPYRRWLDAGVTIGGGSDHMIRRDPIESTNPWDPWLGIWVAVTRRFEGGEALNADQCLSREEALRFYMIDNARLHFEERDKGTIEPGKLADLILVDRDPMTCPEDELRATRVVWTMVGGKLVHQAADADR